MRTGPRAVRTSTTSPPWVTSATPWLASRPAAAGAAGISSRQPSGSTARAASDGQIVAPAARGVQQRLDRALQFTLHRPETVPHGRLRAVEEITTEAQLRELLGEPAPAALAKERDALHQSMKYPVPLTPRTLGASLWTGP